MKKKANEAEIFIQKFLNLNKPKFRKKKANETEIFIPKFFNLNKSEWLPDTLRIDFFFLFMFSFFLSIYIYVSLGEDSINFNKTKNIYTIKRESLRKKST